MRSTENKLIHITCDKGTRQETNKRIAPTGTFSLVQNMRINGQGVMQKRYGTRAIGNTSLGTPTFTSAGSATDPAYEPAFISRLGNAGLVGRSDGSIFAHIDDTSGSHQDALCVQGRFSTCLPVRKRPGIMGTELGATPTGFGSKPPAVAVNSTGYVLVAAPFDSNATDGLYAYIESPDGVRVWVKKIDNQTVVRAKALAVGSDFILCWQVGTTITAQRIQIDGTFAVSTGSVTGSLFSSSSYWDTSAYDSTFWFCGFNRDAGATNVITVQKMSGVALVSSTDITIDGTAGDATAPMSLWADTANARVWVGWFDEAIDLEYAVLNASTMASVLGPTAITTGNGSGPPLFGPETSAANAARYVFARCRNSVDRRTQFGTVTDGGTVTVGGTINNVLAISKPDENQRFWATTDLDPSSGNFLFSRVVLLRTPVTQGIASFTVELASPRMPWITDAYNVANDQGFFHAVGTGPTTSVFAFPFVLTTVGDAPLVKIEVYEYETAADHPHRGCVPSSPVTYIPGQPVDVYAQPLGVLNLNGSNSTAARFEGAAEVGFVESPCITFAGDTGSGTGLAAGTYSYRVVFEWADAAGRRHRSAPSPPCEVTLTQPRNVQIDVSECEVSQRISSFGPVAAPRAVIYRTVSGGTNYHRLPVVSFTSTFVDSKADALIADEEFLYTDGGVLENDLAPSCRFMRYVAGRLWCGGLWDPALIECSKLDVPTEQIAFTGDASHQVPIGADCTGLAVMDDQLVVLTADSILTVVGEGPNDQGIGSFGIRTVAIGVGCVDYRSVVETDLGVVFQSRLGLYLLPRGFGPPQYIGARIQDTFASYPTCLAAAAWNGNGSNLARFLMSDGSTGRVTLDLDVNSGEWFVSTYAQRNNELGVWPSGWVLCAQDLDSDTTPRPLLVEDTSKVADGVHASSTGSHIEQRATTNWITPSGPGGWASVMKFLGAVVPLATSKLHLAVYTDTDASGETNSWDITTAEEIAYRYLLPSDPHGVSFRASIYDSEPSSGPSRGMQFLAITLEFEPDGGVRPPNYGEQK